MKSVLGGIIAAALIALAASVLLAPASRRGPEPDVAAEQARP
jgi:gas vesicle protein